MMVTSTYVIGLSRVRLITYIHFLYKYILVRGGVSVEQARFYFQHFEKYLQFAEFS